MKEVHTHAESLSAVKRQGEREGLAEAIHLGTAVTRGKQTSLSLVAVSGWDRCSFKMRNVWNWKEQTQPLCSWLLFMAIEGIWRNGGHRLRERELKLL